VAAGRICGGAFLLRDRFFDSFQADFLPGKYRVIRMKCERKKNDSTYHYS
jgi:hypothetical protein